METQVRERQIYSGPSKFDIQVSLLAGSGFNRIPVIFKLRNLAEDRNAVNPGEIIPETVTVSINSLEREDGSGECWNFTGHILEKSGDRVLPGQEKSKYVEGFYRTNNRSGWIRIGTRQESYVRTAITVEDDLRKGARTETVTFPVRR